MKQGMEVGSKVATVSWNQMEESDPLIMSQIHGMVSKLSSTQKAGIHPQRRSQLKVKDGVMVTRNVKDITMEIKDGVTIMSRVITKRLNGPCISTYD